MTKTEKQITVKIWWNKGMYRYTDQKVFPSMLSSARWLREQVIKHGRIDAEIPGYGRRVRALAGME